MFEDDYKSYIRGSHIISGDKEEERVNKHLDSIKRTMNLKGIKFDRWNETIISPLYIINWIERELYRLK